MSGGNCGQRLFSTRPSRVCMPLLYLLNPRETGPWGITARFVAGGILPGRALFTDLQTQIDLMYTDFAAGCAVLSGSAVEWGRVTAVSEVSGWRRQCYAWAELYGRHRAERYVGTEWSSM